MDLEDQLDNLFAEKAKKWRDDEKFTEIEFQALCELQEQIIAKRKIQLMIIHQEIQVEKGPQGQLKFDLKGEK
jgi:hypothetical protein